MPDFLFAIRRRFEFQLPRRCRDKEQYVELAHQYTRLANFNTNTTSPNGNYGTGSVITWSGNISGTGQFSRSVTNAGEGGTTILTGANTYAGGTIVNDGILYVNNTTGSGTGSGPVAVNDGDPTTLFWNNNNSLGINARSILAGNGSMDGLVGIGRQGILRPGKIGSPIATLTAGALRFVDTNTNFPAAIPAKYEYDLNSSLSLAAGSADMVKVNGNLSFNVGGTNFAALSVTDLAANSVALSSGAKYTLIDYSGTWDGGTFAGLADDAGLVTVGSGVGPTNMFKINYNDTSPGANGGSLGKYVTLTWMSSPAAAHWLVGRVCLSQRLRCWRWFALFPCCLARSR